MRHIGTSSLRGQGGATASMGMDGGVDRDSVRSLRGLQEILRAKPRDVLDFLIPIAVQSPINLRNALLLETACAAAGGSLTHYLSKILHTVVQELKVLAAATHAGERSAADAEAIRNALQRACSTPCGLYLRVAD